MPKIAGLDAADDDALPIAPRRFANIYKFLWHLRYNFKPSLNFCKDSPVVRYFRIHPIVNGLNPHSGKRRTRRVASSL